MQFHTLGRVRSTEPSPKTAAPVVQDGSGEFPGVDEQLQEPYETYDDYDGSADQKYSMAPFDRPEGPRLLKEEPDSSPTGETPLSPDCAREVFHALPCGYQLQACTHTGLFCWVATYLSRINGRP